MNILIEIALCVGGALIWGGLAAVITAATLLISMMG